MEIRVNENQIDYTLEGEQSLQEVLAGLKGWLDQAGYVIVSARKDGQEVDLIRTDGLSAVEIAKVGRLDLVVEPVQSSLLADLQSIRRFFHLVARTVGSDDRALAGELLGEYPGVRAKLDPLSRLHEISLPGASVAEIDRLLTESGLGRDQAPSPESRERILELARSLDSELEERIAEIIDPRIALRSTAQGIKSSIASLQEVSVLLQTGKDREAMAAIITFTELTGRLVRLFPLVRRQASLDLAAIAIDGTSFPDFYADFNATLTELVEAFGASDSVLIGDLLEYEVAPRLEKLSQFIDLILSA